MTNAPGAQGDFNNMMSDKGAPGRPLSLEVGLWGLLGRGLLFSIGVILLIPAPWVATMFFRYLVEHLRVPGRPNMRFTGRVGDIWWVFVLLGVCSYAAQVDYIPLQLLAVVVQAFLEWMALRWLVSNLSSNGAQLPIAFKGSLWAFMGWALALTFSIVTIIGWAWVITAFLRWNCRNITGTHREVTFNGSGLGVLWRTIIWFIGTMLVIPIPWVLRWYAAWYTSQVVLVERGTYAMQTRTTT
jgi:hypothetical protein